MPHPSTASLSPFSLLTLFHCRLSFIADSLSLLMMLRPRQGLILCGRPCRAKTILIASRGRLPRQGPPSLFRPCRNTRSTLPKHHRILAGRPTSQETSSPSCRSPDLAETSSPSGHPPDLAGSSYPFTASFFFFSGGRPNIFRITSRFRPKALANCGTDVFIVRLM